MLLHSVVIEHALAKGVMDDHGRPNNEIAQWLFEHVGVRSLPSDDPWDNQGDTWNLHYLMWRSAEFTFTNPAHAALFKLTWA